MEILALMPELIRRALLPPYLGYAGANKATSLSERQLRRLKDQRLVEFTTEGRRVLFVTDSLFAYLDESRVERRTGDGL